MQFSKSGVRIASSYRDNLIIDRYHPDLAAMGGKKRDRLRSENSEDALTWNVFRSLAQIDPDLWLPGLRQRAFPESPEAQPSHVVTVNLWKKVQPPPALRLHQGDEGESEIDVIIETESSVWFIEAKFKSDISTRTTSNETRDQIVRNLDVGSWFAGVRDFYFALLIMDEERSRKGVEVMSRVKETGLPTYPHRPDGLNNVKGIGTLKWSQVAEVLVAATTSAPMEDERVYAQRALLWMRERGLC